MDQKSFRARYDIRIRDGRLGGGSFGTVYKAYDNKRDQWMAIKIAELKIIGNKKYSLITEYNAVKDIGLHRNIANYDAVYQYEEANGIFDYAIMQYYPEGNLKQLISNQELDSSQLRDIAVGILRGVHHLHTHRVLHRDLKPSNILISKNPRGEYIPKIADFGLAKFMSLEGDDPISNSSEGGTFEYASPEQLYGYPLKLNADLWSLGVLILQLFSKSVPFNADDIAGGAEAKRAHIYRQILTAEIPDTVNMCPEPFDELVRLCLIKDANERVQSTTDLLVLFETKAEEGIPLPIEPERPQVHPDLDDETILITDNESVYLEVMKAAQQCMLDDDPEGAITRYSKALLLLPDDNTAYKGLRKAELRLKENLEAQRKEEEFSSLIVRAKEEIAAGQYQTALSTLEVAQSVFRNREIVNQLIKEATTKYEQQELQVARLAAIASLQNDGDIALQNEKYATAIEAFTNLLKLDSDNAKARANLDIATKKYQVETKAKADNLTYANNLELIEGLLTEEQFEQARALIQDSRGLVKDHKQLDHLSKQADKLEYDRVLAQIDSLLVDGNVAQAEILISKASSFRGSSDKKLNKLRDKAQELLRYRMLIEQGDKAFSMEDFARATKHYSDARDISEEASTKLAEAKALQKEKLDRISTLKSLIAAAVDNGKWTDVLNSSEQLEKLTPDDSWLSDQIAHAREMLDAAQAELLRQQRYTATISRVKEAIASNDLESAKSFLMEARSYAIAQEECDALSKKIADYEAYHTLVADADTAMSDNDLDLAVKLYESAAKIDDKVADKLATAVAALEKQQNDEQTFQSLIERSKELLSSRKFAEADSLIKEALTIRPTDSDALHISTEIAAALRTSLEKQALDRQVNEEYEKLQLAEKQGAFEDGISAIDNLLALGIKRTDLKTRRNDLERKVAKREEEERAKEKSKQQYEGLITTATAAIRKKDIASASTSVSQALAHDLQDERASDLQRRFYVLQGEEAERQALLMATSGKVTEAIAALNGVPEAIVRHYPAISATREKIESVDKAVSAVKSATDSNDWGAARNHLNTVRDLLPSSTLLEDLSLYVDKEENKYVEAQTAARAKKDQEKQKQIEQVARLKQEKLLAEVKNLVTKKRLKEASSILSSLSGDFVGGDAIHQVKLDIVEKALKQYRPIITKEWKRGQFSQAKESLAILASILGDHTAIAELQSDIDRAEALDQKEQIRKKEAARLQQQEKKQALALQQQKLQLVEKANDLVTAKKYKRAIKQYETLLVLEPTNQEWLQLQAKAKALYEESRTSRRPLWWFLLGGFAIVLAVYFAYPFLAGSSHHPSVTTTTEQPESADDNTASPFDDKSTAATDLLESTDIADIRRFVAANPDHPQVPQLNRRIQELRNEIDDQAYEAARSTNTIAAFEAYKRNYAEGNHLRDADAQIAILTEASKSDNDTDAVTALRASPSLAAIQQFKQQFPNSRYLSEVEQIEANMQAQNRKADYEAALAENGTAGLLSFLRRYDEGQEIALAQAEITKRESQMEDQLWRQVEQALENRAEGDFSTEEVDRYLSLYPQGAHASEALVLMAESEESSLFYGINAKPSLDNTALYLRRYPNGIYSDQVYTLRDNMRWREAQNLNTIDAYQEYVDQNPSGNHVQEASTAISTLELESGSTDTPILSPIIKKVEDGFVTLSSGRFTLGCEGSSEKCEKDEVPPVDVSIGAIAVSKYEVTQRLWRKVMGSNPSYYAAKGKESCLDCPVESITYNAALAFIKKLNATPNNPYTYRLPTEAEWEYAASAGRSTIYAGSNDPDAVAVYKHPSGTVKVGSKAPNAFGLYDMSGNVAEWTSTWYSKTAYKDGKGVTGPSSGEARVIRGGSFADKSARCRINNRKEMYPEESTSSVGLRLVREVR